MPRRAFSLIEVLIAIAVIGAIGGVVFANLSGWTGRARFEAAARDVESAVALARSEAMREGRAMALVSVERDGGTRLEIEPFEGAMEPAEDSAPAREASGVRARLLLELPSGVRVTELRPRAVGDDRAAVAPSPDGEVVPAVSAPVGTGGTGARVMVCVLLPDGGAWGEMRYVVGPGERLAEVHLSAWTGAARVVETAWPSATDDAAAEERPERMER